MNPTPTATTSNRSFTDWAGRTWHVRIGFETTRRVQRLTEVNLREADAELLNRLASDVELLVNVLYAIVQPEADKLGVSDVEFGEQLGGESLDAATSAVVEALIDFFPQHLREVLKKAWEKTTEAKNRLFNSTLENVNSGTLDRIIATELDTIQLATRTDLLKLESQAKIRNQQEQTLNDKAWMLLSGNSPESPASTPSELMATA